MRSLREAVFIQLNENELITAKEICKNLGINYERHKRTVWNYCSEWRTSLRKGKGSTPQNFRLHKPRAWVYVDRLGLKFEELESYGWTETKMTNGAFMFRSPEIGVMWLFPSTGRVSLQIRKPYNRGRFLQLFCNGFSMNGLISDMKILDGLLQSIRFKGAHAVFPTDEKLPYMVIDAFKLSNGIVIRIGDKSHRRGVEVEFCYPNFAEKAEVQIQKNSALLTELLNIFKGEPQRPGSNPERDKPFYVS